MASTMRFTFPTASVGAESGSITTTVRTAAASCKSADSILFPTYSFMVRSSKATAHTPGPWSVWVTPGDTLYISCPKWHIAAICHNAKPRECALNAVLIASAPELLDACKTAVDALNQIPCKRLHEGTSYDVAALLGRVIAKAEELDDSEE